MSAVTLVLAALAVSCIAPLNAAVLRSANYNLPKIEDFPNSFLASSDEIDSPIHQLPIYRERFPYQSLPSEESEATLPQRVSRQKRSPQSAVDLALDHTDRNGNDRPVGRVHGGVSARGAGNDRRNYHVDAGAGAGSVVWRSRDGRHSVGVGATAGQSRGRVHGYRYQSKPSYGAGIGYSFRF